MLNINVKPEFPQKKKLSDQFKMVIELAEESEKVFWIIDFDSIKKRQLKRRKGTEHRCNNSKNNTLKHLKMRSLS